MDEKMKESISILQFFRDTDPKKFQKFLEEEKKRHKGEIETRYRGEKVQPIPLKYLTRLEAGKDVVRKISNGN